MKAFFIYFYQVCLQAMLTYIIVIPPVHPDCKEILSSR